LGPLVLVGLLETTQERRVAHRVSEHIFQQQVVVVDLPQTALAMLVLAHPVVVT
jgi:hypothetical protein